MGKEKDIIAKENIDKERLQFCGNGGAKRGVCAGTWLHCVPDCPKNSNGEIIQLN